MDAALLFRLALAPMLVAGATLAARRWGADAGGWVAALPVVAGPVLLMYTATHGAAFGAQAASSTTIGLVSLAVFTAVYAVSARVGQAWWACLLLGWGSFVAVTGVLALILVPTIVALAVALGTFQLCRRALKPENAPVAAGRSLRGDIGLRMMSALVMVLGLTVVSGFLGSRLSGLVAPFPIIGSVMAAFTHSTRGSAVLQGYSAALLSGLPSFALFTATVAVALRPLGVAAAFAIASAVAVASHAVLITWTSRRRRPLASTMTA